SWPRWLPSRRRLIEYATNCGAVRDWSGDGDHRPSRKGPRVRLRLLHRRVIQSRSSRQISTAQQKTNRLAQARRAMRLSAISSLCLPDRMISSTREIPSRKPSEGETMNWTERRKRFRAILSEAGVLDLSKVD